MPNPFVHTQRIGYGVGTGIASIPQGRITHRLITIRTTADMSEGYILAAADITAAVDMSAVGFMAAAEDTLAEAVVDTPVVATAVTGRGEIC